jgi:hypothetical protein
MAGDLHERVRALASFYAAGVDRCDLELFLSAFHTDATLSVFPLTDPPSPFSVMRGHEEIGRVIERIQRYEATFHFLGQNRIDIVGDDVARGELYCTAYHFRNTDSGVQNTILYIRYLDEYRRGPGGEWRIAAREVHTDAREKRPAAAFAPRDRSAT